jgi:hypothetical protein
MPGAFKAMARRLSINIVNNISSLRLGKIIQFSLIGVNYRKQPPICANDDGFAQKKHPPNLARIARRVLLRGTKNLFAAVINSLQGIAQRAHAKHYVAGLCSGLQRKNMEMIAYLHDQDRQPALLR